MDWQPEGVSAAWPACCLPFRVEVRGAVLWRHTRSIHMQRDAAGNEVAVRPRLVDGACHRRAISHALQVGGKPRQPRPDRVNPIGVEEHRCRAAIAKLNAPPAAQLRPATRPSSQA
jgi:hypothetical protein